MRKKVDLRDAQNRTITWLYEHDAVAAILPMGAGKTASALTAFAELKQDNHASDMFVLAPKRVSQLVWPAEPRLWEHLQRLRVVFVGGTAAQRMQALRTPADIYCIGIDNTQWFVEWLSVQKPERFGRSVLCIDELSRFKNPRGKRAKELFGYLNRNPAAFMSIWGLTGTPRPNSYEDQFMPMKLLTRGALWGKSFDRWRERWFYPLDYNGYNWAIRPESEAKLVEDINTVSITIPLEDMPDLPELNDGPEFVRWIDMPRDVAEVYKRMQVKLVAEMKAGTIAAANMAVATGKLAQIAQGFLYDNGEDEATTSRGAEEIHTLKMEALLDLIEEADGENILVAYEFQEDLSRLRAQFPGLRWLGAGVSDAGAASFEKDWNAGALRIAAVHCAATGHGLNLQFGGTQLIWYGLTWSAELYEQLLKRLHRPGQRSAVFSRPILMRGTVDELKYERVRNKITAQAAFNRLLKEV